MAILGRFFDKFCEICVSSDVVCLIIVKFCTRFKADYDAPIIKDASDNIVILDSGVYN
jgi:hypothetical protein